MRKWSQEDIKMFERAREDLEQKSPRLWSLCNEFNSQNPELNARIIPPVTNRDWYYLIGTRPVPQFPGIKAERFISDGSRGTIAVNPLSDDDLYEFGTLTQDIRYELDVQVREFRPLNSRDHGQMLRVAYEIKPIFHKFGDSSFSEKE